MPRDIVTELSDNLTVNCYPKGAIGGFVLPCVHICLDTKVEEGGELRGGGSTYVVTAAKLVDCFKFLSLLGYSADCRPASLLISLTEQKCLVLELDALHYLYSQGVEIIGVSGEFRPDAYALELMQNLALRVLDNLVFSNLKSFSYGIFSGNAQGSSEPLSHPIKPVFLQTVDNSLPSALENSEDDLV
ncbi:MAG: hypothetical protein J0M35_17160 [Candidatus Obscuribacter phosphatis]|uniref:Uncharacterized protein n=1 Tax=Candidatus Obscuribacter phosphatis TaxID=1906157 RepID=A0A8J7PNF8_9BACT|nr:hypothetical protein [Candidatus Obscuribacter phosphatis]